MEAGQMHGKSAILAPLTIITMVFRRNFPSSWILHWFSIGFPLISVVISRHHGLSIDFPMLSVKLAPLEPSRHSQAPYFPLTMVKNSVT